MFAIERRNKIKEILETEKRTTVEYLSEKFGVSQVTIRRDLDVLENEGFINRTHGGAVKKDRIFLEEAYEIKAKSMKEEKERIAQAAAQYIEEDMSIIIDAGTTCFEVCRFITSFKNLTVITFSLKVALFLSDFENIRIIFLGGEVSHKSKSCVGVETFHQLEKYHADISFISCDAFNINHVSTTSENKAYIKKQALSIAEKSILLATSIKYNRKSLIKFSDTNDCDLIISDNNNLLLKEDLEQTELKYELV